MNKLFKGIKIIFISIILVFIVSYIVSAAFVFYYGKDKIVAMLSEKISEKTQSDVKIGNVGIDFFPFFAVAIKKTSIKKAKSYETKVERIKVYINILKLIRARSPLCVDIKGVSAKLYSSKKVSKRATSKSKPQSISPVEVPLLSGVNLKLRGITLAVYGLNSKPILLNLWADGYFSFIKQNLKLKSYITENISTDTYTIKGKTAVNVFLRLLAGSTIDFNTTIDLKDNLLDFGKLAKPRGVKTQIHVKGKLVQDTLSANVLVSLPSSKINLALQKKVHRIYAKANSPLISLDGFTTRQALMKKIKIKSFLLKAIYNTSSSKLHLNILSFDIQKAKLKVTGDLVKDNGNFDFSFLNANFDSLALLVLEPKYSSIFSGNLETRGKFKLEGSKYFINGNMSVKEFGYRALALNKLSRDLNGKNLPLKVNIKNDGIWHVLKLNYYIDNKTSKFTNIYGTDNYLELRGNASVLDSKQLESKLKLYLPKTAMKNADFLVENSKIILPIRVHGKLSRPDLDINYTAEYIANKYLENKKQELKSRLDKEKQKIQKKLDEKKKLIHKKIDKKVNEVKRKVEDGLKQKVKNIFNW